MQKSPRHAKLNAQAFVFAATILAFGTVAVLPPAGARNLASDPNLAQRVQQFTYKPAPGDLLLKPKARHKKPAKDADK